MSRQVDLSAYVPPTETQGAASTGSWRRGQLIVDIGDIDDTHFGGAAQPPQPTPPPPQTPPQQSQQPRHQQAPQRTTTTQPQQQTRPQPPPRQQVPAEPARSQVIGPQTGSGVDSDYCTGSRGQPIMHNRNQQQNQPQRPQIRYTRPNTYASHVAGQPRR